MNIGKKFKLIHSTFALIIIAFIALIALGVLSFVTTSKLDDYYNKISKDRIQKIEIYGDLNGSFNDTKYVATKVIDRPLTNDLQNEALDARARSQKYINELKTKNLDSFEKDKLNNIENNFKLSGEVYSELVTKKLAGSMIPMDRLLQFQNSGVQVTKDISDSIEHEKSKTASDIDSYNNVSSNFRVLFFVVAIIAVVSFTTVSVFFIKQLKKSFEEMTNTINGMASGDFTCDIDISHDTEFGYMNKQLHNMRNSVAGLLKEIKGVANKIDQESTTLSSVSKEMTATSEEVSIAVNEVATGSSTQSAELMSINNSIKTFGGELEKFVTLIGGANATAGSIGNMASTSNNQMEGLMDSLSNISESFDGVISRIRLLEDSINQANEITGLINRISAQTNLLALNAAIEAARAGEAGRGFSVVADEIRKLADQSRNSSEKISELLNMVSSEASNLVSTTGDVSNELTSEVTTINTSIATFKSIVESVEKILPDFEKVSLGINGLNNDIVPVLAKIEGTSAVAEENSASSEEIAASSEEMNRSANSVAVTAESLSASAVKLTEGLNKFKL